MFETHAATDPEQLMTSKSDGPPEKSEGNAPDPMESLTVDLARDGTARLDAAGPIAEALTVRANIVALADASHDAVLTPREPGGIDHGLRAALAARMAHHNRDDRIAAHYAELLDVAGPPQAVAAIAEPGHTPSDPRLAAIVRHIDLLTTHPRDATKGDVDALRNAGVAEPDIVRLAELAAFVSFQVRFAIGLRLLESAS